MEDNKWMIVKREKMSTKIKNYFKNIFSKILNNQNKKKRNKTKGLWPNKHEEKVAQVEHVEHNKLIKTVEQVKVHNPIKATEQVKSSNSIKTTECVKTNNSVKTARPSKEITIEVTQNKRKPKEIVIEYENKTKPKKKQIVVEYEKRNKKVQNPQKTVEIKKEKAIETKKEDEKKTKIQLETKQINIEVKPIAKKQIKENKTKIQLEPKHKKIEEPQLALKPVKTKKEKKPLNINIFQLFKDKERKKRKEILNRIRENKVDDYETISTKTKLSKGSIAVDDVDANELDPLIDLYRDSNKKLRNRIKESQQ